MTSRLATTTLPILALVLLALAPAQSTAAPPKSPRAGATAEAAAMAAFARIGPSLPAPTGGASSPTASVAASTGTCVAQILRNGKLTALTTYTYKYAFKRLKGGRFKRFIRRVKVAVKVSCAKQCVAVVKKRGKYQNVYSVRLVKVRAVKRRRIVTVKRRRRVYKFVDCATLPSAEALGTPVTVSVLPGSYALLDFGAFQRQAPVSGTLKGFIPGKIKLNSDIQATLNRGTLTLGQTPVFIDDLCGGQVSAAIRTGNPSTVELQTARTTTATIINSTSTVTSIAYTTIRLPLELRNDDNGCNQPYITTGYSEFDQTFFLRGKIVPPTGLTRLTLTSPSDILNVVACLAPGIPTQPCNGFQIPLPILVSTKLIVNIDLSGK